MTTPFRFKNFDIYQDQCAMKVGTDGVLLGAWCSWDEEPKNILDIGTGTGLISLMLAQKTTHSHITALEIDPLASSQANKNFCQSNYGDRIKSINTSLQDFKSEKRFDFIVSNPPFFTENLQVRGTQRQLARHTSSLDFDTLLYRTKALLSPQGAASFIFPYESTKEFLAKGRESNLFPRRITHVKGNETAKLKRSLIEFGQLPLEPKVDTLILEEERHVYTNTYHHMVKDFYLNL